MLQQQLTDIMAVHGCLAEPTQAMVTLTQKQDTKAGHKSNGDAKLVYRGKMRFAGRYSEDEVELIIFAAWPVGAQSRTPLEENNQSRERTSRCVRSL